MDDRKRAHSGPREIADIMERYRVELRNFTDSLPGIIAGNEVPTKRADLVKWQGGFKRAAHHLRNAADATERFNDLRKRVQDYANALRNDFSPAERLEVHDLITDIESILTDEAEANG